MSFSARKCKNYQPKLLFNKANKDTKKVLKSLIYRGLKRFLWYNLLIDREVKAVALFLIGGGRYGVKIIATTILEKEGASCPSRMRYN